MTEEAQQPEPSSPPAPAVRKQFGARALLAAALLSGAGASLGTLWAAGQLGRVSGGSVHASQRYTCPMHPQVVRDDPDALCPLCNMRLVPLEEPGAADAAVGHEHAASYQCPMHPSIVRDGPGDCPVCGMKLVPVQQASPTQTAERKVVFYRSPMDPKQTSRIPRKDEMGMDYVPVYEDELLAETTVSGMAVVRIDATRQQLIGLRTEPATRGSLGAEWRTVGRVAVDETRVRHINVRVPAYVEQIHVNFVGRAVRKGEPLFSVYSPELLAAQQELLLALRTARPEAGPRAESPMVAAAKRKLELWNVPDSEIAKIMATEQPLPAITLYSPIAGVVTKKDVVEGMQLDIGAMPYEVVDLSQVWVLADVYETELRRLSVGMTASFTLRAFPGKVFEGKVSFVAPVLNPETRTASVRLAFANLRGELRPDMFGEVVLHAPPRVVVRVPRDAVIDSGTRSVVFVALGDGKFQPREVSLGETDASYSEVISGVAEGELVVTRANFLVDSESRLRASLAALAPNSPASSTENAPAADAGVPTSDAGSTAQPTHAVHSGVRKAAPPVGRKPADAGAVEATPAAAQPAPVVDHGAMDHAPPAHDHSQHDMSHAGHGGH